MKHIVKHKNPQYQFQQRSIAKNMPEIWAEISCKISF